MTNPLWLVPVFAPVVLVTVVLTLLLVRGIRSRGGYAVLMRRYSTKSAPPEEAYAGQTAQIGSSSWKQRVTIGIGQRGLYLQPKGAVVRYTALEVPWSHMRQEGDGVLQGEEMARIMVVPPQVGLLVPRDVWAKAERYAKR